MWITALYFSPGVILQVFVTLSLVRVRDIRDNTPGSYTGFALRVRNGLNVVPVGCLAPTPPILEREHADWANGGGGEGWTNVHTWN